MADPVCGEKFREFFVDRKQFSKRDFEEARETAKNIVRPCLKDEKSSDVQVSYPEDRVCHIGLPEEERPFTQCLARKLVAFVSPDAKIYTCVERAPQPEYCLGSLLGPDDLASLYKNCDTPTGCDRCPPVCLLFETNALWHKLNERRDSDRVAHDIETARKYFERHIASQIGTAVNFI